MKVGSILVGYTSLIAERVCRADGGVMDVKGDIQMNMRDSPDASIPQIDTLPAFASACVLVYAEDRQGTDRPERPSF